MTYSLADQIRSQARMSARAGQLEALEALADQVVELERERDQARAELQQLHNDTQQAFTAIAAKQRRDAEHIAELENRS